MFVLSPPLGHNLFLSFQFFDLDDHLWGDGAFMIEHGVGEGMFGNGSYFSGDAEGEFVDCFDGAFIEEWFSGPGQFELMIDVPGCFLGV